LQKSEVLGAIERMPEAGEKKVSNVIRNGLATRIGIHPKATHTLQTRSPVSTHHSTARARTTEPEAARGARPIGLDH
jgi:hypothetical protein